MAVTIDKLDRKINLGPYFVFLFLLFLVLDILDSPGVKTLSRKIATPQAEASVVKGQSLYRLPAEVRLKIFKEVFFIDRGNMAIRSLMKALHKDPLILD